MRMPFHHTPSRLAIALVLGASLGVGAVAPSATAQTVVKPPAPAAATVGKDAGKETGKGGFREIKWDDLVPADWDPMKAIKGANFGMFSDSDPRAAAMLKQMREAWDQAPVNNTMDGAAVRIPGYVVPLEESKAGLKEFLLVPYFGACIHSPPPPANQIIHVTRKTPVKFHTMDPVWVTGTLKTLRSDTFMGATGYRMEAVGVEAYTDTPSDKPR